MGLFSSIGSLFGPIGTAAGAVGDTLLARDDAEKANTANVAQAQEQRAWQEKMRGNAYQATVSDLQAAGLNPMLAYSNGPTSAGSGANSAPMQNKGLQASQTTAASAQAQNIEADTVNKRAQTEQIDAQTQLIRAQTENTVSGTGQIGAQTDSLRTGINKAEHEIEQIKAQTGQYKQMTLTEKERTLLTEVQKDLEFVRTQHEQKKIDNTEAATQTQRLINKLKGLEIPGAENEAEWATAMGNAERAAGLAGTAARAVGGTVHSAQKIFRGR